MAPALTENAVSRMLSNENVEDPKVQLIGIKTVAHPEKGNRYRVIISDGTSFTQCMLSTSMAHLVEGEGDGIVKKFDIVTLKHYSVSEVQGSRLLVIVLNFELTERYTSKIGEPANLDDQYKNKANAAATAAAAPKDVKPKIAGAAASKSAYSATSKPASRTTTDAIYPIESLSPYQNRWTIKARVSSKSEIKHWNNARGSGRLFSVNFLDESGEIKATGFNDTVDQFYQMLKENHVYTVTKAKVQIAKKQFSNLSNEYEITFEKDTRIEEVEDTDVPVVKYDLIPLGELSRIDANQTCDLVGIVDTVGETSEITSKATNKVVTKRELTLVDQSDYSVRLTMWGKQAENFTGGDDHPVMLLKGVKVGDFGGRSLSMFSSTQMTLNPDTPEAFGLRGWYDEEGQGKSWKQFSSDMAGGGPQGPMRSDSIISIGEAKDQNLGMQSDKPDWFGMRATVVFVRKENLWYTACPTAGCNKKVIQDGDRWRCEKCNKTYEEPAYRYIFSANVADPTGSIWVSGFNDIGEQILGLEAKELYERQENDQALFEKALNNATNQMWSFSIRAKQDTYQETTRVRYTIQRASPLDWAETGLEIAGKLLGASA